MEFGRQRSANARMTWRAAQSLLLDWRITVCAVEPLVALSLADEESHLGPQPQLARQRPGGQSRAPGNLPPMQGFVWMQEEQSKYPAAVSRQQN